MQVIFLNQMERYVDKQVNSWSTDDRVKCVKNHLQARGYAVAGTAATIVLIAPATIFATGCLLIGAGVTIGEMVFLRKKKNRLGLGIVMLSCTQYPAFLAQGVVGLSAHISPKFMTNRVIPMTPCVDGQCRTKTRDAYQGHFRNS